MGKACNTRYVSDLLFKECNKCQCYYALSEYHKNKNTKLGVTNQCKPCVALDHKKYVKGTKKYYDIVRDSEGNMVSRVCVKCNVNKPALEFHKNSCASTGYSTSCKECSHTRVKANYALNKDKYSTRSRQYYQKNAEQLKQYQRQYTEANKEKVLAKKREYGKKVSKTSAWKAKFSEKRKRQCKNWRTNNASKVKDYNKSYKKENYDLCCAISNKRLSSKRSSSIKLQKEDNNKLLDIYKKVRGLNKNNPRSHHVDHIVPLNHSNICGLHVPWNMQIISQEENTSKRNKWDGTYDNTSWRQDL